MKLLSTVLIMNSMTLSRYLLIYYIQQQPLSNIELHRLLKYHPYVYNHASFSGMEGQIKTSVIPDLMPFLYLMLFLITVWYFLLGNGLGLIECQ